jgi:hypothetical protein
VDSEDLLSLNSSMLAACLVPLTANCLTLRVKRGPPGVPERAGKVQKLDGYGR